jgi:hypothetical protein
MQPMRAFSAVFTIAVLAAWLGAALPGAAVAAGADAAPPGGAEKAPAGGTTWGLVARGGYYGVPDAVAGEIFHRHPEISGWIAGAELRYYGDGGGRGISSIGLAVDHGYAEADGLWQAEKTDRPVEASGSATMTAITLTGYWNLFPSWFVHPYIGLGIGAAYFEGEYEDEGGPIRESGWLPAVHIPIGLAFEFGEHVQLSAEARFIDGFAAGGALQLRF